MGPRSEQKRSNGLVAIILITRSIGPKLVFHYPAVPHVPNNVGENEAEENVVSDEDSDSEEVDSPADGHSNGKTARNAPNAGSSSVKKTEQNPLDHVLGYSVDSLEKQLSPGRWSDLKKFEICLDGLTFLSYPTYANEDGTWSKEDDVNAAPAQADQDLAATPTEERKPSLTEDSTDVTTKTASIAITAPETPAKPALHDFTHVAESLDSSEGMSLGTSLNSASTTSNGMPAERVTMFNVLFVLSSLAAQSEVFDLYEHVVKKFSKALHYCQKQSGYVATESRRLLALRGKAKLDKTDTETLWSSMIESSELAWALKELYEKLSAGQVAGIRLNGMEMSLQVPLSNDHTSRDGDDYHELKPHSGLLLLEEKDALLRELSHSDASPLAFFIREHLPTKSLQKQANKLGMPLDDIFYLARHLIRWRKARAIAPLHARNMYVVGSEAPIAKVPELVPEYARRFPALPSLPQMLKMLSGKPIKYGLLIPSRDHRTPYMEILAYLVKHDFVNQLKTYGWLTATGNNQTVMERPRAKSRMTGPSLLSPHLKPIEDDNVSVSSERTAIPLSAVREEEVQAKDENDQHSDAPMLILDPLEPTEAESERCKVVQASIDDAEFRDNFFHLLPYFDGEHVLEEIAAKEGLKRARVEDWLGELERQGHLLTFKSL